MVDMTSNGYMHANGDIRESVTAYPTTPLCVAHDASEEVYLHSLQPLDDNWVRERLSKPPFVEIDGVTNARTLGGYACKVQLQDRPEPLNTVTRQFLLYRSGEVSGITEKGACSLTAGLHG
jgi:hypothetical protein